MLTRELLRHHQQLPFTLPKIILNKIVLKFIRLARQIQISLCHLNLAKQLDKDMIYFLTLSLFPYQIFHLSQKTASLPALTAAIPSQLSYYKTAMDRNRLQKELRPVQTPIHSCASTFSLLHKHTEDWKR